MTDAQTSGSGRARAVVRWRTRMRRLDLVVTSGAVLWLMARFLIFALRR